MLIGAFVLGALAPIYLIGAALLRTPESRAIALLSFLICLVTSGLLFGLAV